MLWILLIILLIAVFGIGAILEAALWTLVIVAAVVIVAGLLVGRLVTR